MFFNNIAEELCIVPEYMIEDTLKYKDAISPGPDPRAILGKGNAVQGFAKMTPDLQKGLVQISTYIMSQQLPLLKDMVVYETLLVNIPAGASSLEMPTRYLCRVGELLIAPLTGSITMTSGELPGVSLTMTPGNLYRINNRMNSAFTASSDFLCAAYNMLDFDLKRFLMPHDISSPFIRRQDEHFDPNTAQPDPVEDPNAY